MAQEEQRVFLVFISLAGVVLGTQDNVLGRGWDRVEVDELGGQDQP